MKYADFDEFIVLMVTWNADRKNLKIAEIITVREDFMSSSASRDYVEAVKRVTEDFFSQQITDLSKLCVEVARGYIRNIIRDPTKCVGVFGPYGNGGEIILHTVGQKVSREGFAAISGSGYYLPNDPSTFHPITEIVPPLVFGVLGRRKLDHLFSFRVLPGIVSKGTFNMAPPRTQYRELLGCYERGLPLFGYLVVDEVARENSCPHLDIRRSGRDIISGECTATDPRSCPGRAVNPPFSPFYTPYSIPWDDKKFFLYQKENILLALTDIECIDSDLHRFLISH